MSGNNLQNLKAEGEGIYSAEAKYLESTIDVIIELIFPPIIRP